MSSPRSPRRSRTNNHGALGPADNGFDPPALGVCTESDSAGPSSRNYQVISQLQAEFNASRSLLETEAQRWRVKAQDAKSTLRDRDLELRDREAELRTHKEELIFAEEELSSVMKERDAEIAARDAVITVRDAEVAARDAEIASIIRERDEWKTRYQAECKNHESRVTELCAGGLRTARQVSFVAERYDFEVNVNERLEEELRQAVARHQGLETDLIQANKARQQEVHQANVARDAFNKAIDSLQSQIAEKTTAYDELLRRAAENEDKLQQLRAELATAEGKVTGSEATLFRERGEFQEKLRAGEALRLQQTGSSEASLKHAEQQKAELGRRCQEADQKAKEHEQATGYWRHRALAAEDRLFQAEERFRVADTHHRQASMALKTCQAQMRLLHQDRLVLGGGKAAEMDMAAGRGLRDRIHAALGPPRPASPPPGVPSLQLAPPPGPPLQLMDQNGSPVMNGSLVRQPDAAGPPVRTPRSWPRSVSAGSLCRSERR